MYADTEDYIQELERKLSEAEAALERVEDELKEWDERIHALLGQHSVFRRHLMTVQVPHWHPTYRVPTGYNNSYADAMKPMMDRTYESLRALEVAVTERKDHWGSLLAVRLAYAGRQKEAVVHVSEELMRNLDKKTLGFLLNERVWPQLAHV